MVNFTILAGGFSSFIATYVFDSDAASLSLLKQNPTGDNPSWIASHRTNKSVVYAVNEFGPVGNVQSFIVDEAGSLTLVDTAATGGNGPTYLESLTTGEVTGLNFGSPNASFIATNPEDPARFIESPAVSFPVNGGPSNPHQSLEFNGEVFIPDLGADKIWRVVKDAATGAFQVQGQIDIEPGNGPRHIAIRDNVLFVLNEKTSVLSAHQIPAAPNGTTIAPLANVSIVPPEAANFNGSFFAAEIVISESPNPLIYVSNRNLGPDFDTNGDSIAIFEFAVGGAAGTGASTAASASTTPAPAPTGAQVATVAQPFTTLVAGGVTTGALKRAHNDPVAKRMNAIHARRSNFKRQEAEPAAVTVTVTVTETAGTAAQTAAPQAELPVEAELPTSVTLTLVNHVFTGLKQIRSFAIGPVGDGADEFLIAGANVDGGVAVFRRTEGGRNLTLVARNTELQNRTSFVFL